MQTQLEQLTWHFKWYSQFMYGVPNGSPLYAELAMKAAYDSEMLLLVSAESVQVEQAANLLFAATHYLLLSGVQHPLREFYPSFTAHPHPVSEAYPIFRAFCREYAEQIKHLVSTKHVQTNEVQRCASLLPAFELVSQRVNHQPLTLIEIGASAGLNLFWDQYHYDYGTIGRTGERNSPVRIRCEVRGDLAPPIPAAMPAVASRVGIDLEPIDVQQDEAQRWLHALIWAEQLDRAKLMTDALTIARQNPPPIITGNLLEKLPEIVEQTPPDAAICVYHSYTFNQFALGLQRRAIRQFAQIGLKRDFYRIALEWYWGQRYPALELYTYHRGEVHHEPLAYCHNFGTWIEWLLLH